MSATGRSDVRHPDDFYATPAWCTRSVLPHLRVNGGVLDPCAGDGAILRVTREAMPWASHQGIELDPLRATASGSFNADALAIGWGRPGLIITNPPYKIAMDFVQKAVDEVAPGGTVAMLLRLPWLASQGRAPWLRKNTPSVYVLPKRPSFTGNGTDATDYAWMVWDGRTPTVRILDV